MKQRDLYIIGAAFACCVSLLVLAAVAQTTAVPGDLNGDRIVSDEELKAA